ncbi:MAG: hypothetical protein M3318_04445 [Actinomycetota bacterium]|nr:hypothetical protein [Actinomycetota bacterium]
MHTPNDQPKTDQATDPSTNQPTDRRVSVAEAAVLLDLSEAAVRSRLKRGTLRKEKAKDGTVLVVLGTGASPDRPTNSTVRPNDRSSTGQPADQGDLVEALRDQVVFLRQQLEEEREANRENRRIIAGLVQRVPELGPAQEPREGHVTDSEEPNKGIYSSTLGAAGDLTAPLLVASVLRIRVSLEDDRSKGFWRSLFGRRSAVYWRPPWRSEGLA